MNQVTKIFADLTDDQLREAVNEIREDEPLGIIRNGGYVRELSRQYGVITGESSTIHITMTQISIWREAAYRFS